MVNIERSGQGQSLYPDCVIQCYLRDLLIHTVTQVTAEVCLAMLASQALNLLGIQRSEETQSEGWSAPCWA